MELAFDPAPGQAECEGGPNWTAHSRPLYFSRLSGANSTQSFGTVPPRFRHPPNPRTEAALAVVVDVVIIITGSQLIANTVCIGARLKNWQPGRGGACVARPMQAEYTHGCLREITLASPLGANQHHALFTPVVVIPSPRLLRTYQRSFLIACGRALFRNKFVIGGVLSLCVAGSSQPPGVRLESDREGGQEPVCRELAPADAHADV